VNSAVEYFGRISSFDASVLALVLVLAADLVFTGIHIWQECCGGKFPLYRAFGAIVGFWFPRWIGFLAFTVALAAAQWFVGLLAYTAWPPIRCIAPISLGVGCLGVVLGARVGDSIISHWAVRLAGYKPNPGFPSTAFYALEAVLILSAFRPGLALDPASARIGFGIGFGFFVIVMPLMLLLRVIIKPWRRERWIRGREIPDWVYT
jgi:hypothetical protein